VVASVIVKASDRQLLEAQLLFAEEHSDRHTRKWSKSSTPNREKYMRCIAANDLMSTQIYGTYFNDRTDYGAMTSEAIVNAIRSYAGKDEYRATIIVDALNDKEKGRMVRSLKRHGIRYKKVRGAKKDENWISVRLADSVAGMLRSAREGNEKAATWESALRKKGILC